MHVRPPELMIAAPMVCLGLMMVMNPSSVVSVLQAASHGIERLRQHLDGVPAYRPAPDAAVARRTLFIVQGLGAGLTILVLAALILR